jgi:hypothetical protein
MIKQKLYMENGKGCHSYLIGHKSDNRPWYVIGDETDTLKINVSWSGIQYIRYESGWKAEHKVETFSRPISYAKTIKREWMSQIDIPSCDHLKFWADVMHKDDNLTTFGVESNDADAMAASGAMYSTGAERHSDPENKPRSALLIVHNDGFFVEQEGLNLDQPVGKILILHPHKLHSLLQRKPSAERWAAIFFDYEGDLSFKEIEEKLEATYLRIFAYS